jgi:acyl-CoA thioester hydrolase
MIDMKGLLELRVYYEDTDFSARVYHASYLRFLERGRTEWLRSLGFEHRSLSEAIGLILVVRQLSIEFLAPALIDDVLRIETDLSGTRGAVINFDQTIFRGDSEIARAAVGVVCLRNGRPVRVPGKMIAGIENHVVRNGV